MIEISYKIVCLHLSDGLNTEYILRNKIEKQSWFDFFNFTNFR